MHHRMPDPVASTTVAGITATLTATASWHHLWALTGLLALGTLMLTIQAAHEHRAARAHRTADEETPSCPEHA